MYVKLKGWLFPGTRQVTAGLGLSFHLDYIIIPLIIVIISLVIAGYFYRLLPAEVSYRFQADGSPDKWVSRSVIMLWFLIPQFLLLIMAVVIAWGMTRLAKVFWQADSHVTAPQGILRVMGNMVALPQIMLGFAILDIFSYNSYQIHLIPLWMVAVVVMGLGGIILGIFFIKAVQQVREAD